MACYKAKAISGSKNLATNKALPMKTYQGGMMNYHTLQIGIIKVTLLNEGIKPMTEDDMRDSVSRRYPNTSDEERAQALAIVRDEQVPMGNYMTPAVIESGGKRILVDVGFGKHNRQPHMGWLAQSMTEAGISPDSIDIVFLTHLHGDHYMGISDADGKPYFPNASYACREAEWEGWFSEEALARLGADRVQGMVATLMPFREQFTFMQAGDTLAEGVTITDLAGHTHGQAGLMIESDGEKLHLLVDLLHHPAQMHFPDWHFVWDSLPELGVQNRKKWLADSADNDTLVHFYHLPFPGVGKIVRDDDAYRWQPLDGYKHE
jgi:glyoxylase-like metal-dependent hydrolase (beta-lactamase superfamily II)